MDATLEPLERETLHIWAPAMVSALVGDLTGALELMRKGPIPPAFVMRHLANAIEQALMPVVFKEKDIPNITMLLATLALVENG